MKTLSQIKKERKVLESKAQKIFEQEIQALSNKYKIEIATGHLSDIFQVNLRGEWVCEYDRNATHPFFKELSKLETKAHDCGARAYNCMHFHPKSITDER